jgi:hypothetical protein
MLKRLGDFEHIELLALRERSDGRFIRGNREAEPDDRAGQDGNNPPADARPAAQSTRVVENHQRLSRRTAHCRSMAEPALRRLVTGGKTDRCLLIAAGRGPTASRITSGNRVVRQLQRDAARAGQTNQVRRKLIRPRGDIAPRHAEVQHDAGDAREAHQPSDLRVVSG